MLYLSTHQDSTIIMQAEQTVPTRTRTRNCVVPNRKPKDKPRFNKGAKSKEYSLKQFEERDLCRPSKEYLQVKLVSMVDDEGRCSMRFTLSTSLKQAISD
ncbi:hypothetical protein Tco_0682327 [Tanacetum coccineum]|uniref:Uncharacterized protein n=1 Tax=Tanacetum coccineum TaxID=301880 RepID=A0ABQ4XRV9_9ASTR